MTTNVVNQVAYLRTSREFPEELHQLSVEVNKAYVDTANCVNNRIISIFPTNRPAITGESFFLRNNQRQQAFRQVYTFTSTAAINHGITNVFAGQFTPQSCGSYTDGINSFGLPFGTSTATPGLITFYVNATQILFSLGAGAPALTSGMLVLSWLSPP